MNSPSVCPLERSRLDKRRSRQLPTYKTFQMSAESSASTRGRYFTSAASISRASGLAVVLAGRGVQYNIARLGSGERSDLKTTAEAGALAVNSLPSPPTNADKLMTVWTSVFSKKQTRN